MKALLVLFSLTCLISCRVRDLTAKDAYNEFVGRNDYRGGVSAFEQEIAAHPADVRLLVGLGLLHYSFGEYAEATFTFERALSIDPMHPVAHNYLALALSAQAKAEAALKHLDLALKADPTFSDAHFNRAVILVTKQPPEKVQAREAYKRAISLGSEPDSVLENLLK
jgi:tetratricopeptide (TPR) repeat protein